MTDEEFAKYFEYKYPVVTFWQDGKLISYKIVEAYNNGLKLQEVG